jgi:hypothetical protein
MLASQAEVISKVKLKVGPSKIEMSMPEPTGGVLVFVNVGGLPAYSLRLPPLSGSTRPS